MARYHDSHEEETRGRGAEVASEGGGGRWSPYDLGAQSGRTSRPPPGPAMYRSELNGGKEIEKQIQSKYNSNLEDSRCVGGRTVQSYEPWRTAVGVPAHGGDAVDSECAAPCRARHAKRLLELPSPRRGRNRPEQPASILQVARRRRQVCLGRAAAQPSLVAAALRRRAVACADTPGRCLADVLASPPSGRAVTHAICAASPSPPDPSHHGAGPSADVRSPQRPRRLDRVGRRLVVPPLLPHPPMHHFSTAPIAMPPHDVDATPSRPAAPPRSAATQSPRAISALPLLRVRIREERERAGRDETAREREDRPPRTAAAGFTASGEGGGCGGDGGSDEMGSTTAMGDCSAAAMGGWRSRRDKRRVN
uniref:Uncharacterized protein n=1 Tax=Oryza glumipatula TaxID=40148 RepID=A0A0D9Y7V0_9ORYZ